MARWGGGTGGGARRAGRRTRARLQAAPTQSWQHAHTPSGRAGLLQARRAGSSSDRAHRRALGRRSAEISWREGPVGDRLREGRCRSEMRVPQCGGRFLLCSPRRGRLACDGSTHQMQASKLGPGHCDLCHEPTHLPQLLRAERTCSMQPPCRPCPAALAAGAWRKLPPLSRPRWSRQLRLSPAAVQGLVDIAGVKVK